MKEKKWNLKFGLILIGISALLYAIHLAIFKDPHHVALFFLEDLAFIPIEVLVVSLIFEKVLNDREKKNTMEKLNMLIGVFFNEVGGDLLKMHVKGVKDKEAAFIRYKGMEYWDDNKFMAVANEIRDDKTLKIDLTNIDINKVRDYLRGKRQFLLSMLQNPSLLEHDTFTELLQAVFHLQSELDNFGKYNELTEEDMEHLTLDFERVYPLLKYEWLIYLKYMKNEYPYAFSMTVRNLKIQQ